MKILFINNVYPDYDNPTAFVFVHQQARALQNAGYEICVLDIDLRSARWKRRLGIYKDIFDGVLVYRVSIPFVTTKLRTIGKKLNRIIGLNAAKRIFNNWGKADIIHAHFGFGAGDAGVAIKKKYNIPLVVTEHSSRVINAKNKNECWHFFDAYNNADAILCVGNSLADKLKSFGIQNVKVVPNIIENSRFKIFNREKNRFYTFISVGHLNHGKNQSDLIKAFAQINKNNKLRLIIVGKGEDKKKLLLLSQKYGCEKTIRFIDRIPNDKLPLAYGKADCFVLPSLFETFGVVYAEAISCGIPAISYRNGGAEDIINDSVGILTDANSVGDLARAMESIQEMSFDKRILHEYIKVRFGTESFIKKIGQIYSEVK